jgi:hypothetical protein
VIGLSEREWRVVRALASCPPLPDGKLYLQNVDPLHLTCVIVGWCVSKEDHRLVFEQLTRVNPSARLIGATFDRGKISLSEALS